MQQLCGCNNSSRPCLQCSTPDRAVTDILALQTTHTCLYNTTQYRINVVLLLCMHNVHPCKP